MFVVRRKADGFYKTKHHGWAENIHKAWVFTRKSDARQSIWIRQGILPVAPQLPYPREAMRVYPHNLRTPEQEVEVKAYWKDKARWAREDRKSRMAVWDRDFEIIPVEMNVVVDVKVIK